ncbi:hypothetical protein ABT391_38230, partial [Streptomyces jumonjinensis]
MSSSRPPSATTGTDFLLYLMLGAAALGMGAGFLAWLFGNLANLLIGSGAWVPYDPAAALLR